MYILRARRNAARVGYNRVSDLLPGRLGTEFEKLVKNNSEFSNKKPFRSSSVCRVRCIEYIAVLRSRVASSQVSRSLDEVPVTIDHIQSEALRMRSTVTSSPLKSCNR
ncbi:unnamed protein product [Calypogeia fissa]